MAIGAIDAPVVLSEWVDFRCPFCAVFSRDVLPQLVQEYVDEGKVRIEVHDVAFFGDESLRAAVAARAAGEKSLAMMHVKDLLAATGYVRGGCSPVGMKKRYRTLIDETCVLWDTIFISGGKRGYQLELAPDDLIAFCGATVAAITRED